MALVTLPAAAQAAGMRGGCGDPGGIPVHAVSALYAALAVLGYWVLQHASKETASYIKKTGLVLGMALVIIGLLGLLCGVGSHINKSMERSCTGCPEEGLMMRGGPGMMMHGVMKGRMGEMPAMPLPEGEKAPEPAAKKAR
jgi:hypothetical protein